MLSGQLLAPVRIQTRKQVPLGWPVEEFEVEDPRRTAEGAPNEIRPFLLKLGVDSTEWAYGF